VVHHQTGSHAQLRHPAKLHLRVTVPRHDRFDLPKQVLRSILRQAEMSVEEFLDLL
jgi:predicted RNA binding protein YcfA (HicA-like mRNA interferase family)